MRSRRAFAVVALVAASAVVLGIAATDDSSPTRLAQGVPAAAPLQPAAAPTTRRGIIRALRREQRKGTGEIEVEPPAEEKVRCARANSETWFSTANARLMYLDPSEDPESTGPSRNRAAGCLYATGTTTEFGFSNMIEGSTFGHVTGAGDFTAFAVAAWQATDGAFETIEVWNLRTGSRTYRHSCATTNSDCAINDIAVSEAGSVAYVAWLDREFLVIARPAGSRKRKVLERLPTRRVRSAAILRADGRLYWLTARGRLRSIAFP